MANELFLDQTIVAGLLYSVFRCDQQFRTGGDFAILAHHSCRVKSIIYPQSLNLNDVQAVSIKIYNNDLVHVVTCV